MTANECFQMSRRLKYRIKECFERLRRERNVTDINVDKTEIPKKEYGFRVLDEFITFNLFLLKQGSM